MSSEKIRVYYKAAVWPPFFTIAIPTTIIFVFKLFYNGFDWENAFSNFSIDNLTRICINSGVISLACTTMFLNSNERISGRKLYCVLAWFALPLIIIGYILTTQIAWEVIDHPKDPRIFFVTTTFVNLIFHIIGLVISFKDFYVSLVLEQRENARIRSGRKAKLYIEEDFRKEHQL